MVGAIFGDIKTDLKVSSKLIFLSLHLDRKRVVCRQSNLCRGRNNLRD